MIKCTECGKDISDKAVSCPNCGCPTNSMGETQKNNSENMESTIQKSNNKKWIFGVAGIAIVVLIAIIIVVGGGSKASSLEDEIYSYAKDLQDTYGKISVDFVKAYCDGENQYIILYYYGLGKNYDVYGDTYIVYTTSKDGKTEIYDPNGDVSSLSNDFMNVKLAMYDVDIAEYKDAQKIITYEEFKNFQEGYIDENFFEGVNDKLNN